MLVWTVRMILLKSNGEITSSIDWSRGIDFWWRLQRWLYAVVSRFVKMKKYLPFVKNLADSILT